MTALSPNGTSPLAPTMSVQSATTNDEKTRIQWRDRITQAREARRPFEGAMLSDLAFAAGQHWLVYDTQQRRMRHISELDARYADRELFTADRITEYRMAQLGELESDDDRPSLLVVQEGEQAEQVAEQLNRAVEYAWDHEWKAEDALALGRRYCVDLGVSALRCRWDPDKGKAAGHVPVDAAGQPVDDATILHLAQHGQLPEGGLPKFKQVNEGATVWEAYSALHLLPPPGVHLETDFPWEVIGRPVPLDEIIETYPHLAGKITEDGDIANVAGVTTSQQTRTGQPSVGRLRNHAWVYTCFERPCKRYPQGGIVVLVSAQMLLAEQRNGFDYQLPDGTPHSGVVYLHWRRRSDRFWSGSFISPLKDPQRIINRRETQNSEIIDRGMPRTYVKQGDLPEIPTGAPGEIVEMSKNASPPQHFQGSGPGTWMYADLQHHTDTLSHASTLSALRLGENPQGVETYSQLAMLNDNETSKRATILRDHRRQIATLVELGVYDIRRYWPDTKQILVAGVDDQIAAQTFEKSRIPDWFMVQVATGAPSPRSQGAQLKMVDAIWAAAVESWVAVNDGATWVGWYADSVKSGKALDLPAAKSNTQHDLAYLENQQLFGGEQPQVMDYDLLPVHLPVHREAEDQARAAGDMMTVARIVRHVQDHMAVAQQNAQQQAAVAAGQAPLVPGQPAAPGMPGAPGASGAVPGAPVSQFANFTPFPHNPPPQMEAHAFRTLASGQ